MLFLVYVVSFSLFSFMKVSAPMRLQRMMIPQVPISAISQSRFIREALARFTVQQNHEMRKKLEEIIKRIGSAECLHHDSYVRQFKQPQDLYDGMFLTTITKYWASVNYLYVKNKSPLRRFRSNLEKDIGNEMERMKTSVEGFRSNRAQITKEEWVVLIFESAERIFDHVQEFKKIYGIPQALGTRLKSFLEECSAQNIALDMISGIADRIKIELQMPDLQKSKNFFEILKAQIQNYNKSGIQDDFDGFKYLWIRMIDVMKKRVEQIYDMENRIDDLNCGGATFEISQQIICRDFRNQFNLLTLRQMKQLVDLIRK